MEIVKSPIEDFYAGRSVFITGASGFVGQVIVERLLSTCKDVDKIYVLMRDKRNKTSSQRHSDIVNNALFAKLKEERPEDLKKIIPVIGDIALPEFGLSEANKFELIEKVSVVMHCAATIRFTEPLHVAMNINLESTRRVLDLCKQMKNIKVLVYVSTAYSQVREAVNEEKIYSPPADLDDLYRKIKENGGELTKEQETEIIGAYPNTYSFSKAMAEAFVADYKGNVPVIILRPSIVGASKDGPTAGWLTGYFGATGIMMAIGGGLSWSLFTEPDYALDIIPVDYVANAIIAVAAKCKTDPGTIQVFNQSSNHNRLLFKVLTSELFKSWRLYNLGSITYFPFCWISKNSLMVWTLSYMQRIPTYLADIWLSLSGQKPRYVKMQDMAAAQTEMTEFFSSRNWFISTDRTRALYEALSDAEKETFPFDASDIKWPEYINTYVHGIKKYILKQK